MRLSCVVYYDISIVFLLLNNYFFVVKMPLYTPVINPTFLIKFSTNNEGGKSADPVDILLK